MSTAASLQHMLQAPSHHAAGVDESVAAVDEHHAAVFAAAVAAAVGIDESVAAAGELHAALSAGAAPAAVVPPVFSCIQQSQQPHWRYALEPPGKSAACLAVPLAIPNSAADQ